MTGRKGQSRRIASASLHASVNTSESGRSMALVGAALRSPATMIGAEAIKIRIGGEVSQGLQLRDSIIVVSGARTPGTR